MTMSQEDPSSWYRFSVGNGGGGGGGGKDLSVNGNDRCSYISEVCSEGESKLILIRFSIR